MLTIQAEPMNDYAMNKRPAKNHLTSGFFEKELQKAKEMEKVETRQKQRDTYCKSNLDYLRSFPLEEELKKTSSVHTEDKSNAKSEQESETNTNIIVNPDGTRVLVITMKIGGMEATTSIELSKNTGLPGNKDNQAEVGTQTEEQIGTQINGENLGEIT